MTVYEIQILRHRTRSMAGVRGLPGDVLHPRRERPEIPKPHYAAGPVKSEMWLYGESSSLRLIPLLGAVGVPIKSMLYNWTTGPNLCLEFGLARAKHRPQAKLLHLCADRYAPFYKGSRHVSRVTSR